MVDDDYNHLSLALADAATNCARDNATATITLRSGVQLTGKLKREPRSKTTQMEIGLGWATVLTAEIVAVQAHAPER